MKQRLVIALLAALCFGAGFVARMWTDGDGPAVPPPPTSLGGEFTSSTAAIAPATGSASRKPSSTAARTDQLNRAKLLADIDRLRPQINSYRARLDEIDAEFERGVALLLTSEQRERFEARQKRNAEHRAKGEARAVADTGPLSDEQVAQLQQRPLWNVLWSISINARFDRLHKDVKFDEAQIPHVRELYRARREKFLALVDTTPPPSITLSELATQAKKIGGEPAKK